MNKLAIAACVALSLSGTGISRADATVVNGVPTVAVRYDDLDLSNREDNAKLYARVKNAARQVCQQELADAAQSTTHGAALHRACFRQMVEGAVTRINRESFTAFVASGGKEWVTQQVAKK